MEVVEGDDDFDSSLDLEKSLYDFEELLIFDLKETAQKSINFKEKFKGKKPDLQQKYSKYYETFKSHRPYLKLDFIDSLKSNLKINIQITRGVRNDCY